MEDELKGQISFMDYCTNKPLDIKPKHLCDFINGMGTAQYTQISNVINKTAAQCKIDNDNEETTIGRITNDVSVWLLKIGNAYGKYLDELIIGG